MWMSSQPKTTKSGSEKSKIKNKKLLEAAGTAANQKSLHDCFQKCDNKSSKTENDEIDVSSPVNNEIDISSTDDNEVGLPQMVIDEESQSAFHAFGRRFANQVVSPFETPNKNPESICAFLQLHPVQPYTCRLSQLFTRVSTGEKKINRNWLSYNCINDKYYCYVCMAFDKEASTAFQKGASLDPKHCTTRVREHEAKLSHISAAESFIRYDRSRSIADLINHEQHLARLRDVKNNQEVVKRIIEWIFLKRYCVISIII